MGIGKLRFTNVRPMVSLDVARANAENNMDRGLPFVEPTAIRPGSVLGVIGSAPSITEHGSALKDWPGDLWAINGTWVWAKENGIDATFFSLCCGPDWTGIFPERPGEADHAIITSVADPSLLDIWSNGNVRLVDTIGGTVKTGATTATGALVLGPLLGYSHVVFFGCDSSYRTETETHAHDRSTGPLAVRMMVRAAGADYLTVPEFMLQAEALAEGIRGFPFMYSERSGGLLSGLVADPDYDVVAASRCIADNLSEND